MQILIDIHKDTNDRSYLIRIRDAVATEMNQIAFEQSVREEIEGIPSDFGGSVVVNVLDDEGEIMEAFES